MPLGLSCASGAPGALSRQTVERRIQFARSELGLALDLAATLPPVGVLLVKDLLRRRLRLAGIRLFLTLVAAQGPGFFFSLGLFLALRAGLGVVITLAPFGHHLLQLVAHGFHAHVRVREGAALQTMRDGQLGGQQNVLLRDAPPPVKGGMRPRRLEDDEVGAVPVDAQTAGQRGDGVQVAPVVQHLVDQLARGGDALR